MRAINGRPVGDEQIQAWADEAEAGYDVEEMRRRGRPLVLGKTAGSVVQFRMDQELLELLARKAQAQHMNRSEALRAAVRAWVDAA